MRPLGDKHDDLQEKNNTNSAQWFCFQAYLIALFRQDSNDEQKRHVITVVCNIWYASLMERQMQDIHIYLVYSGMLAKDGSLTLPPASPNPATGRL